jgi:hypothetical protein
MQARRVSDIVIKDAGDVEAIIASGDMDAIKGMFAVFYQVENKDYAEMKCEAFFGHPDPSVRLSVVVALQQIAERFHELNDWDSYPFLEAQLEAAKAGSADSLPLSELRESLHKITDATGYVFDGLYGCGASTSCAFVGDSAALSALKKADYYDLKTQCWDYPLSQACGSMIDNIDGRVTFYLCESCREQLKDLA